MDIEKIKENKYLGEILPPMFYWEEEGKDNRIAIRKFIDVFTTLSDAAISLTYANEEEYREKSYETVFVRRIHMRHAINDLNSAYDLLLQIPWFYYRLWNTNKQKIIRNSDGWVEELERQCREEMVINQLCNKGENGDKLASELKRFNKKFINNAKSISVRTLANNMKHKRTLEISELSNKMKLNLVGIDELLKKADIKLAQLNILHEIEFSDKENASKDEMTGKIIFKPVEDDTEVDFEFYNGEKFRGIDSSYNAIAIKFEEIYFCCVEYYNAFLEMLYVFIETIYTNIPKIDMMANNLKIEKGSGINLNRFFIDGSNKEEK